MIQLTQLLTEITLGAIKPYATQFTWKTERYLGKTYYESSFNAEGQQVDMTMSPIDNVHDETEYIFVFMTQDKWGLTSYSHQSSVAKGQLDYLRLIRTVGEAIIDFCTQYAPESVDVSGGDADPAMEQKKNRIYAAFLQDNAARLAQAGYTHLVRGSKIWLVRKSNADSTGVSDS
jgi:hypothetical protein